MVGWAAGRAGSSVVGNRFGGKPGSFTCRGHMPCALCRFLCWRRSPAKANTVTAFQRLAREMLAMAARTGDPNVHDGSSSDHSKGLSPLGVLINVCCVTDCPRTSPREKPSHRSLPSALLCVHSPTSGLGWRQPEAEDQPFPSKSAHRR